MDDGVFKKFGLPQSALEEAARTLLTHSSLFEEQNRFEKLRLSDTNFLTKALSTSSATDELLAKTAAGTFAELIAPSTPGFAALETAHSMFQRPEIDALIALQQKLSTTPFADIFERYHMETSAVSAAMEAMRSPWLDMHNQARSITAFAELHGIGHALATVPSFDDHLTLALRTDLGDWRGPLKMDSTALLDRTARTEFYVARGFDTALTDFPPEALRDGLQSAGLYERAEPVQEGAQQDGEDLEAGFMRTNEAHDRLMRFEYHLRAFVDAKMTESFGPGWIRQRVPEHVRNNWERKRDGDRAANRPERVLISYSDLSDYLPIIIRNDNWKDLFGDIFGHKPSVEESFRRLYPVRNCTMHASLLTQDDALLLLVELMRLGQAFGFKL
jgi:hypothetical protein